MPRAIDQDYFLKYAGSGKAYDRVWRDHSWVEECIGQFKAPSAPRLKSICILGAATGHILKEFHRAFDIKPKGCEIEA